MTTDTADRQPKYDVGYGFYYEGQYARVIAVESHNPVYASDGHVYICVKANGNDWPRLFDADEMGQPWAEHVAAETDRLIAQASALHGQTRTVLALSEGDAALLRRALHARYFSYTDGWVDAQCMALHDRLNGVTP